MCGKGSSRRPRIEEHCTGKQFDSNYEITFPKNHKDDCPFCDGDGEGCKKCRETGKRCWVSEEDLMALVASYYTEENNFDRESKHEPVK